VLEKAILAYLSAVSLPIKFNLGGFAISRELNLVFMLFMALRESLRIKNFVCPVVFIISMAFKITSASAEKIEH